MEATGRKQIIVDAEFIDESNLVSVLRDALITHWKNKIDIEYLYDYYRGRTPIRKKTKEIRPSINYKINENRAAEIVNFKLGYCFGEPIQYIRRGSDETLTDDIDELNNIMFNAGKETHDNRLAEWMYVAGTAYRMILPAEDEEEDIDIYTLDPRYAFVVRSNDLARTPLMGVTYIVKKNKDKTFYIYTKDRFYEVNNEKIVNSSPHMLGRIPIIEYPLNDARQGAFEIVLDLLDALNSIESNRLDDIVQTVNSFLALMGGALDEETIEKLEEYKILALPEGVDAKYLSDSMKQADVQVLVDSLYDTILTICSMPNRNGGSSTSDTGAAVIMRDGWSNAEADAKSTELMFKGSEREFLKIALEILKIKGKVSLTIKEILIKFSRRNYEAIATKSTVLTQLLSNNKIHPELAFTACGLFVDPEAAYLQSMEYFEEVKKENERNQMSQLQEAPGEGKEQGSDDRDKMQQVQEDSDDRDK